jgi:hypothetical protein
LRGRGGGTVTAPHATPEPSWIPVAERPKSNGLYQVTLSDDGFAPYVFVAFFHAQLGEWMHANADGTVTAWMPLPQPYVPVTGGRDDKA